MPITKEELTAAQAGTEILDEHLAAAFADKREVMSLSEYRETLVEIRRRYVMSLFGPEHPLPPQLLPTFGDAT